MSASGAVVVMTPCEAMSDPDDKTDLLEVLWARLGPRAGDEDAAEGRREALKVLGMRRRRRRRAPHELDPEVAALFGLIAAEPTTLVGLTSDITAFLSDEATHEFARGALPAIFQSYVRAVARIVAAESSLARDLLTAVEPADRARILDAALEGLLPISSRGFDTLHRVLLLDALAGTLPRMEPAGDDGDPLAVAMVDLVGSTNYLKDSAPAELERIVDALFEAAQTSTANRPVHVVKYVGDGIILSGSDVGEVANAAGDILARLQDQLPLQARAGLAWGPVLERAGDIFGLPINTAHILTKAAKPGMLLATAEAAAQLPTTRRGRYRMLTVPHPALGATRVATVKPRPADSGDTAAATSSDGV